MSAHFLAPMCTSLRSTGRPDNEVRTACWAVSTPLLPQGCRANLAPSVPSASVPLSYLPVKRPCALVLSSEPCIVSKRFDGPRLVLSQVPWYTVPNTGRFAIIDMLCISGDSMFWASHGLSRSRITVDVDCGKQQPNKKNILRLGALTPLPLLHQRFFSSWSILLCKLLYLTFFL